MRLSQARGEYKRKEALKIRKEYSSGKTNVKKLAAKYEMSESKIRRLLKSEAGYMKNLKAFNLFENKDTVDKSRTTQDINS